MSRFKFLLSVLVVLFSLAIVPATVAFAQEGFSLFLSNVQNMSGSEPQVDLAGGVPPTCPDGDWWQGDTQQHPLPPGWTTDVVNAVPVVRSHGDVSLDLPAGALLSDRDNDHSDLGLHWWQDAAGVVHNFELTQDNFWGEPNKPAVRAGSYGDSVVFAVCVPNPTPTPTPTATATPTETPVPPTVTPTVTPTASPTATQTPSPSPTPTATATPTEEPTLEPVETPEPTPTLEPDCLAVETNPVLPAAIPEEGIEIEISVIAQNPEGYWLFDSLGGVLFFENSRFVITVKPNRAYSVKVSKNEEIGCILEARPTGLEEEDQPDRPHVMFLPAASR